MRYNWRATKIECKLSLLEVRKALLKVNSPKRILVSIRLVEALREVLQGIASFVKTNRLNWQIQCVDADEFVNNLGQRQVDGAVTVISPRSRELIARVKRSGVPTVNMFHNIHPTIPSVLSDDQALGSLGARYFLERGLRNFAFLGIDTPWSQGRQNGFVEVVDQAGHRSHLSETHFRLADYRLLDTGHLKVRLRKWAESLPRPVGVMACSDLAARALLISCERAGLRVPEEVAILGVDNIVETCELASVPLSSAAQNFPRLGFEAARLLDRLMSRRKAPGGPVVVPPGAIVVRRSTDFFTFDDQCVASAMKIIHQRAGDGFGMKELVNEMALSRKWLDVRFKATVGHTPSQEIRRVRLSRVRDLLLNTDLSVQQIARRCGFSCGENLIRFFREGEGLPPQQYRNKHRGFAGTAP